MVLEKLDNQSLSKSKEASKEITEFLNNERFYWIQTIKKYIEHFKGHEESWREVMYKIPINTIKELGLAVKEFFRIFSFKNMAPFHITAGKGSFQLCKYVIAKV